MTLWHPGTVTSFSLTNVLCHFQVVVSSDWRVLIGAQGSINPVKLIPKVGAYLVAAGAQGGKSCVADCAFHLKSRQAAVGFHVGNLGFDGVGRSGSVSTRTLCRRSGREF